MAYKTTRKDFQEFKSECQKWIDYFGLLSFDFYFFHEAPVGLPDCRAACRADYCARLVALFLNPIWGEIPLKNEIKLVAFHEVCEALLSPLQAQADARYVTEDEIEASRHGIISILSNTLFRGKKP